MLYLSREGFPYVLCKLFADFVFFVCDIICTGVEQFPMTNVTAAAHDDIGIGSEVTYEMDQVSRCVVVRQHNHHNSRVGNACVFEYLSLRRVAQDAFQAVAMRDVNVVLIQINDDDAAFVGRNQSLGYSLAGRSETDDEDRIGCPVRPVRLGCGVKLWLAAPGSNRG